MTGEHIEFDVLIALAVVLLLVTPRAHANESHCYSIQNADTKNACLATVKRQASYCYSIQAANSKNLCLAQVNNQKSYCYSISSQDMKNQCLALVKKLFIDWRKERDSNPRYR